MRVICDDCPLHKLDGDEFDICSLGYGMYYDSTVGRVVSLSCRLIKISTKDGEILPEEVKE